MFRQRIKKQSKRGKLKDPRDPILAIVTWSLMKEMLGSGEIDG